MFDLKVMKTVIDQLEEERGIPREKLVEAIEAALATAYKKEYGKRGQIVRAKFSLETGTTEFFQVKVVVDETMVVVINDDEEAPELAADDERIRYNSEHHILIDEARLIKKDVKLGDEMVFPLENKDDYGRIAAQTAKQVIIQKIREAEKVTIMGEFGKREGDVVAGTVQRVERGSVFVDLGKASGVISAEEQIRGENWNPGDRIRAYLFRVEESPRGIFLRLSRSHPKFLEKLFEAEVPEIANGTVEVKSVSREAGARSKIAVWSTDEHIDPIGSLVGGRGVRVNTVSSELNGEKIDIVEWSEDPVRFIEEALSPAEISSITLNNELKMASVTVAEDQLSLAIGKGGQNVRLAAKLTGWKIDIKPTGSSKAHELENEAE
jgi:transcription termination/antitermination protein NusA